MSFGKSWFVCLFVCLFSKSFLTFLTFVNCKSPYLAEGFHHQNLCPCFDIVFVQLGVIPQTRSKFVEIVAAGECYLVTTHIKNKESQKQLILICPSLKLADGRMSRNKEKKIFVLNLQYCQFVLDSWKNRTLFMKTRWIWTSSQMFRKFSYWKNLLLFSVMLNKASADLQTLGNNIYTKKSSTTNIYLFKDNNRNIKKSVKYVQS